VGKVALIGGGGVRSPLLMYGLNEARKVIGVDELVIYDTDLSRAVLMAKLGEIIVGHNGGDLRIGIVRDLARAVDGASFVLNSIRVGGIAARARDERIALEHGYPGQETTGPGGLAMALRTIPVILKQAKLVEQYSPKAWFINFTNPAGLITQALTGETSIRVVGICDTPSELFHRIALALEAPIADVECEYVGLNHLGWVKRVRLRGEDVTARILASDAILRSLYATNLFDPSLIRNLGLIPTEYLFFYYARSRALENQRAARATRGEEIARMNESLFSELSADLQSRKPMQALETYENYLKQRSGSYMKLEANAGSAFAAVPDSQENPFASATGYHRIALEVMEALSSSTPRRIVVNVRNQGGALQDFTADDVIEVPCLGSRAGLVPEPAGTLPDAVKGLVLAVKAYERAAIKAALQGSLERAQLALLLYPPVGEWEPAAEILKVLIESDPEHLGYLRNPIAVS
jgi:6-phospho-beta-glucosidase